MLILHLRVGGSVPQQTREAKPRLLGPRPEPRQNPVGWKEKSKGRPDLGSPPSGTRSFWDPRRGLLKPHRNTTECVHGQLANRKRPESTHKVVVRANYVSNIVRYVKGLGIPMTSFLIGNAHRHRSRPMTDPDHMPRPFTWHFPCAIPIPS